MVTHFSEGKRAEWSSTLRYLLWPTRPPTSAEKRFRNHGYFRVAIYTMMAAYFIYCNPEYSYLYTYIRERNGWNNEEPAYPQYFKIVPTPPSLGQKDELLDRLTYPLRVDAVNGLLWSVDGVAGGTWLGLELKEGRFAVVTNCRRSPSAPLTGGAAPVEAAGWRGAAPLQHALSNTYTRPEGGGLRTIFYEPVTSRGTIIKDYLQRGILPGTGTSPSCVPKALQQPYYAGYNLLTCESLYGTSDETTDDNSKQTGSSFSVSYTTNRYDAEYDVPLSAGTVHCLQNSFLDNWSEPKCTRLRTTFSEALEKHAKPLGEDATAPFDARQLSAALANECLCDQPNFDIRAMMQEGPLDRRKALEALLDNSSPLLGLTPLELALHFGEGPAFTDEGERATECLLQRNIFVEPEGGYGTRVQSVVVVERDPLSGEHCVHFSMRDAPRSKEERNSTPWQYYVSRKGGVVEDRS